MSSARTLGGAVESFGVRQGLKQLVDFERRRFHAWSSPGRVTFAVVEGPQDAAEVESLHWLLVLVYALFLYSLSGHWR